MHKWSDAARMVESVYELPSETFPGWDRIKRPGGNLLIVYRHLLNDGLAVVRVPSVVNRKPIEWWGVPPLPFRIGGLDAYTPDNVLAVAGECGG